MSNSSYPGKPGQHHKNYLYEHDRPDREREILWWDSGKKCILSPEEQHIDKMEGYNTNISLLWYNPTQELTAHCDAFGGSEWVFSQQRLCLFKLLSKTSPLFANTEQVGACACLCTLARWLWRKQPCWETSSHKEKPGSFTACYSYTDAPALWMVIHPKLLLSMCVFVVQLLNTVIKCVALSQCVVYVMSNPKL